MCVSEIWTYDECGCQYLDPIPCHDRVLLSPKNSHPLSENWALVSHPSSSSISSVCGKDAIVEADEPMSPSLAHQNNVFRSQNLAEAAYNHRLHLVRTCSIRQTIQKTFLEPICDDCVLLELGLAPELASHQHDVDDTESDERNLDGAEWLLESSVEITVDPPLDDGDAYQAHSNLGTAYPFPETGSEDETPRRGRGRRTAMEIARESLVIDGDLSVGSLGSFQKVKQTGQHLRRARKRHDLRNTIVSRTSRSTSSSARSSSWIGHLKSDLGQRVRRKRPDIGPTTPSNRYAESFYDASSSATEDDRILSLPSIPATVSSTFSASSTNALEVIMPTLDQTISSSEFSSSFLSDTRPSVTNPTETLQPTRGESVRPSTSSSKSAKSFRTATGTATPSSSPIAGLVGGGADKGISLHPLSCPLPCPLPLAGTHAENRIGEDVTQGKDGEDDKDRACRIMKGEHDDRSKRGGNLQLMDELVEAGIGASWAVTRNASS
jgi:hypothetical protein